MNILWMRGPTRRRARCAPATRAPLSQRLVSSLLVSLPLVSLMLASAPAPAQSTGSADQAFAASNWTVAAREYRALLRNDSTNIRAHFRYGVSLFELADYRSALPEFERSVRAGFQVNVAEFRLARAYTWLKEPGIALDHLERAAAAGVSDELITTHADLAPLRALPRYLALITRLTDAKYPCRNNPVAHQFDFWIGEWTVTPWDTGGRPAPVAGHSTVSSLLEQCLILEEWTPTGGPSGKSFNFWDTNRNKWRQVWMSADAHSLDYEGVFESGAMRFSGWTLDSTGTRVLQKLTFTPVARDTVRQLFEESHDGGGTWKPTFDGRYVRRP